MSYPVVGMIGIGQLGLPIASNLLQAGLPVVGYRRSDRAQFVGLGGVALDSPREVAGQADVILLCLPGEAACLEVLEGEGGGLLSALRPGQLVVELGTYARAFKLAQARKIEDTGARVLECEVSGSPPMVAARKAALLLGGDDDACAAGRAVLDAISPLQFRIGRYGDAVNMKLIANHLVAVHTLAAAEAMQLAIRAGFDPHRAAEVIGHGAGASTMFNIRAPLMAARRFTPALGAFQTLDKYIDFASSLAAELGCATPLLDTAMPYFKRALAAGMEHEDIAAVIKLLEAESAPPVPSTQQQSS
ncbi:NAD(P)-dependent oxidoreductase [Cupriavidus necator]|uniref:NAD(P)-dependent oxidoreductase n=1 Tax=Cupriavidus necator TaxID=106590 RepID=A0A1U9UPR3_CUPNE|nr:NAD(P)-dependent oxidoreductase [Cupriavidus necator]AQV94155.1 NAD(P)-dependent oxidoreductase [Cupriavidus necator]